LIIIERLKIRVHNNQLHAGNFMYISHVTSRDEIGNCYQTIRYSSSAKDSEKQTDVINQPAQNLIQERTRSKEGK